MNKKKTPNRFLSLLLAALMLLGVFYACAKTEETQNNEPENTHRQEDDVPQDPEPRDDLIVAMESEPPTLHPFDHTSVTAGYMNALTYNALFKTDPVTLEPVPDLCESYEQLDEVTWQFKIYDNVKFHDGSHMTAEDVVASMEYAQLYPTTKQYSSFWTDLQVVDETTLQVTTDGPYALTLLDMASLKVVPKALIDSENDFNQNPIGSGPYKFVSQELGDKLEFEAFEDYFDQDHQPTIKYMTWRIIPEGSSRTIALEAGEVDFVVEVETNDMERLREAEDIEVQMVGGTRVNYFSLNNEVYPFDNPLVRQAIDCAIDREAVLTVALNGEGKLATSVCPTAFSGTSLENVGSYDPERAKALLEQSGVDMSEMTFTCIVSTDVTRRAAEVIQAFLQEVGITIEIESLDYAAWLQDVMGGTYETAITGYTAASLARYLTGTFHTSALNAANQARLSDPRVDELIDLVLTQTDPEEAAATYREVTAYLNSLSPYVPLYESIVTRAYNARLQGVVVGASGGVRFEDVCWSE